MISGSLFVFHDEATTRMDEGRAVDIVYVNLKTFDTVSEKFSHTFVYAFQAK